MSQNDPREAFQIFWKSTFVEVTQSWWPRNQA